MFITKSKQIENLKTTIKLATLENNSLRQDLNDIYTKLELLEEKYKTLCKNYNGLRKKHEKILTKMAFQMDFQRNIRNINQKN